MSRSSALILLGILVVLAPLSGLPESWITALLALLGIGVALMGVALRAEHARRMGHSVAASSAAPLSEPEQVPDSHHPSAIA